MTNYKYAAIPTRYNSIEFDSRLEARTAAWFDELCIPWNYRPFDLDGWLPDFQIGWTKTLVEVKPCGIPHGLPAKHIPDDTPYTVLTIRRVVRTVRKTPNCGNRRNDSH